ncbi:sodium transporter HKT1-like [Coffea eugenioides]|uniref:sodium transporter HKT1-like n=1 Tax=Coffea eugenioides TaxID=49369 RepID=UPI000F607141|nr:sodium transporter HKT1-like [Coffea eugenioides]
MMRFVNFGKSMKYNFNHLNTKACLYKSLLSVLHFLLFGVNKFWIELSYFISFSVIGYLALKISSPKDASFSPQDFDIFFMSVSAVTVSSMSTVEMEVFSNAQLILLTIFMFLGGEVFTSLLGLQLMKFKRSHQIQKTENKIDRFSTDDQQLGNDQKPDSIPESGVTSFQGQESINRASDLLAFSILCYLLVVHLLGSVSISIYNSTIPSANEVLRKKGLNLITFSVFTTVSTFANCGFVPTNENMMVFKKNSGLLLIMFPQLLLGNTLYPACLRSFIWFLSKITKRSEFAYLLKNPRALGYDHLFSDLHSIFLAITVFGFILAQFVLFSLLEWHSGATAGLSAYEKLMGSLFQVVNSRHAGESVFDLSLITPAIIVLFVLMMYLPPYTSFLPIKDGKCFPATEKKTRAKRKNILDYLLFSQLTYLVLFVILICITEREKLNEDPLNFNLLSVVVEVISGYGNVGFSMGYSCGRQVKPGNNCKDASYGFAGKWSTQGKFILIIVMFFGRLKKFNTKGGKAWRLS